MISDIYNIYSLLCISYLYRHHTVDLKDHFKQAGTVVRADVLEEAGGRSKGCGLVEFATVEEAQRAIDALNDSELKGRLIFVREDREGPAGHAGSGAGAGSGIAHHSQHSRREPHQQHQQQQHNAGDHGTRLFVGNIAWDVTWMQVR
jgi:RNA recognition motif-containing protein